jgi:hypothetical protein
MKLSSSVSNWLNKLFLAIPLALFLLSLLLPLKFGLTPATFTISNLKYDIWKYWMYLALFFYELSATVIFILWLIQEKKTIRTFVQAYKNWFIGLLLTFFSYALAGLVIDLGWLVYFIFLSITKK